MESNSTAFLIKIKLRHSLGRPSRSDFVQSVFIEPQASCYISVARGVLVYLYTFISGVPVCHA